MMFIKKYGYYFLIISVGMIAGIFYWKTTGCISGACPITSHWHTSASAGGILGFLAAEIVRDTGKTKKNGS